MTTKIFNDVVEQQLKRCTDVLIKKASEYAADHDRLHNFKVAAVMHSCPPIQALAGMMAKHSVSVYDMCNNGEVHSREMWDEKITDHINYLILLRALVAESHE